MSEIFTPDYTLTLFRRKFAEFYRSGNDSDWSITYANEGGYLYYTIRYKGFHVEMYVSKNWDREVTGDAAAKVWDLQKSSLGAWYTTQRPLYSGDRRIDDYVNSLIGQIIKAGIKYADGQRLKPKPKMKTWVLHTEHGPAVTIQLDENQTIGHKKLDAIARNKNGVLTDNHRYCSCQSTSVGIEMSPCSPSLPGCKKFK
jgi:hypothetical protein